MKCFTLIVMQCCVITVFFILNCHFVFVMALYLITNSEATFFNSPERSKNHVLLPPTNVKNNNSSTERRNISLINTFGMYILPYTCILEGTR